MDRSRVMVGTIASANLGKALKDMMYDIVVVDEAGMATEPDTVQALIKSQKHSVLVGDRCQLGPHVSNHQLRQAG